MKQLLMSLALGLGTLLPAASQAEDTTALEIGYMPILPISQLFVALEEGWIAQAQIEPELVQFQNGPAMVQALLAGQLDVAYIGIGPAMVSRARGADIKVVASNIVEQISVIALGELAPYFEEDPATAFKRFASDKGRKPVITTFPVGSVPETVFQYWLRKQLGADPNEVEIIYQGAAQVQQALLTAAVDAAAILEPIVSIVLDREETATVVASGSELFPSQPGAVLAIRQEAILNHPEAIEALVAAHARATNVLKTDAARAAPSVGKYVGGGRLPAHIVLSALERSAASFVADPNFIVDGTQAMHDFQAELGTLKKPVDLGALFDVSIFDRLGGS
ncbi:MAG: ABC transporter substrate-binding protein [Pseudomonadota bacterium]